MAEKQPSNEDGIPNHVKTRERMMRRVAWILPGGIAVIGAAMAAAAFSGHAALVSSMRGQIVIGAVAGALFVYALVMIAKCNIAPTELDSPRLVHRRMDSNQRAWRRSILFTVVMMFVALMSFQRAFPVLRAAHLLQTLAGPFVTGMMLLLVFILSVGPGWSGPPGSTGLPDDEFDRALRTRMMRFGYIVVMLVLSAVFLVALWQPALALTALIWALYAGFAVPALYYLVADWRASRATEG